MAKSKSSNISRSARSPNPTLDSLLSTFKPRPAPRLLPVPYHPQPVDVMPFAADRRRYDPTRSVSGPAAVTRGASRVVAGRKFNSLRFADPHLVGICARRQVRREVMFALRKTRKGSGASKRRNFWSAISCR